MTNKTRLLLGICLLAAPQYLDAQSTTSPYTLFGIGEVDMGNYGENAGMGGLGIGFRQSNTLNSANPASLTEIAPKTFVFDGAAFGKYSFYSGQGKKENALSGNLQRIALGFQAAPGWATSIGLTPFSSIGYNIKTSGNVEGSTEKTNTLFSGTGGLSRVYWANAVRITPQITAGFNTSVIFGSLLQTEEAQLWSIEKRSRTSKVYFDFGLQYADKISKNMHMTIGVVGGYKTKLNMHNTSAATNSDGTTVTDKVLVGTTQYIPEFYGIGTFFTYRNKLSFGADYRFQKWSCIRSEGTVHYTDMHRGAVGISYIPNTYNPRKYAEVIKYQLGFTVNNSYIRIGDTTPVNYAITAGVVLPMKTSGSFSVGLEYGKTGTARNGIIRENYMKLTLGFSFKESWFVRYKYD